MSNAPKMEDALQVLDVLHGPDERGRHWAVCPECGEAELELVPSGASAIATCKTSSCMQYRINQAIKGLVKTRSNGHEPTKTSPKKTAATETETEPTHEAMKAALVRDPITGAADYFKLQARAVAVFGAPSGIFVRQCVFWSGLSTKLEDGWFYKSQSELRKEIGLGKRDQATARAILTGRKPYAGRTFKVLEERRANPTAPTEFRVDLKALADVLNSEDTEETP